jgi:hypothetical protein
VADQNAGGGGVILQQSPNNPPVGWVGGNFEIFYCKRCIFVHYNGLSSAILQLKIRNDCLPTASQAEKISGSQLS